MTTQQNFRKALLLMFIVAGICQNSISQTIDMAFGYRRSFNNDFLGFNGQSIERDSIGWSNPYLLSNLPRLNASNIRYPGGGAANWWDWKKGWFVDDSNLPSAFQGIPVKDNRLENFKKALDATGANAILVLNMISSTLSDQLAMLKHADSIGVQVKFVELGEEFYIDGGEDSASIVSLFPTSAVYGTVASQWADSIHKYFPNAKVAAQGAYNRNNANRRVTWDENMYPSLSGENVITFHGYMSAAKADEAYNNTFGTFTIDEVPTLLSRPFTMWNIMSTEDLSIVPAGDEVWITEFNLRDKNKPTQGTWAHGLFAATQTMQFLNDTRIKRLTFHSMDGTAVAGVLFNGIDGYNFGDEGHFCPPPVPPASTQYWGLTSSGRAMQQLGLAMKNMLFASPLEFSPSPLITAIDGGDTIIYPSLYGWTFISNDSTQAIIVNLSANEYKVQTSSIFPAGGKFERYYGDALLYVAYESDLSHKGIAVLPDGAFTIKAYSISRIKAGTVPAPPPTVSMVVTGATTFCDGDSVKLDAGANYIDYLWSTGETTKTIWAKSDGAYWVRVRNVTNGYWAADTVIVTVFANPDKPNIKIPNAYTFCEGDTFTLDAKYPDPDLTYFWSTGETGTTAHITNGGSYYLYATNSSGCAATSDAMAITEFAAPKPLITPAGPVEACYDNVPALNAGAGFKLYTWSNGKFGQTYTPTASGTFYCTVQDNNLCFGTSNTVTVTVNEPPVPVVTINGPTAFCDATTPTYLQAPSGYSYQWLKGKNVLAGETNSKYYPTKTATYKVKIIDAWGCTKKSDGTSITVYKLPSTKITLLYGADKKICVGTETVTMEAKYGSGYTYKWKLNGVFITGATNQQYTASAAGDYTYKVTDPNGCTALSAITTITNTCKGSVGSEDAESISLLDIYPNPAAQFIHVHAKLEKSEDNAVLEIRNLLGMVVYSNNVIVESGEVTEQLSVADLLSGVYFISIKSNNQIINKKFIIDK